MGTSGKYNISQPWLDKKLGIPTWETLVGAPRHVAHQEPNIS